MEHADRIIVIVLDSVRADALKKTTAPNLTTRVDRDWLAYENAFASAPWTLPSHASIFTGQLPREHGATAHKKYLSTRGPTIAEWFASKGYHTRLLSNNPFLSETFGMTDGFEEVVLHLDTKLRPDATGIWVTDILERSDNWTETVQTLLASGNRWTPVNLLYELLTLKTELIGPVDDGANRTINYYLENDVESPEFVFFNFMEPHIKYEPPEPFRSQQTPSGVTDQEIYSVNQEPWDFILGKTDTDFDILQGLYDGEIAYLDSQLDRFFQQLESEGVLDESLIVLCGDHGDHFGEHGFQGHAGSLHRELLHVPLFLRFPGGEYGGESLTHPVSLRQLFTSLLEWMEIDVHESPTIPDPLPRPGESASNAGVIAEYMGVQDLNVDSEALKRFDYRRTSILTEDGSLIESANGVEFQTGEIDTTNLIEKKERILADVPDNVSDREEGKLPSSVWDRLEAAGYIQ